LCRDCPELHDLVQGRIQTLEAMHGMLELADAAPDTPGTAKATRTPPADWCRPGSEPIAGYCLQDRLGKGGFGEVWRATAPGGFNVALKFVSLEGNDQSSELRSVEIIRDVRHPNVLTCFGAWRQHGFLIIAMELAQRTLLDRFHDAVAQGLKGIPRE